MVKREVTVWLKNGKYYCWFNDSKRYFIYCYTTPENTFKTAVNLSIYGGMPPDYQLLKESESEKAMLVYR